MTGIKFTFLILKERHTVVTSIPRESGSESIPPITYVLGLTFLVSPYAEVAVDPP